MGATDELREMLDERGIEYEQSYIEGIASYTHVTKWETQAGSKRTFYEVEDGYPPYFTLMLIESPTPEQAVEMTVERTGQTEVVRCKDCVHSRPAEEDAVYYCDKETFGLMGGSAYCSLGKRRGEGR